jgi:hypothetical protein
MRITIPNCPWCDKRIKWLETSLNFSRHEEDCMYCGKPIHISSNTVVTVHASKVEPFKIIKGGETSHPEKDEKCTKTS